MVGLARNNKIAICCLLLSLCLIPYLNVVLFKNGFSFIIYLVFYTYLPGYYLYRKLNISLNNLLSFLCSFYLGVAIIIFEYYVLFALNILFVIKYINLILSFFIVINLIKKIKVMSTYSIDIDKMLSIIIVFFISYYLCLFMTNFKYPYNYSSHYPDISYQIANIATFVTSQPFNTMTVYGVQFKYHYFFYLFLAVAKIIFNTDAYILLNHYVSLFVPILIAISFYEFFNSITINKFIITIFSIIAIFNCLSPVSTQYILNLESAETAVGFGIPLFLLLVLFYNKCLNANSINISDIILAIILTIVLTGIKGPFGLLLILSTIFYNYLFKKNYKLNYFMLSIFVAFVLTYIFVVSLKDGKSYFDGAVPLGSIDIMLIKDLYYSINNKFLRLIIKLLNILPNFIIQFNIFIFPVIYYFILSIYDFFNHKDDVFIYYTIIASAGIFAAYILMVGGSSNMYFVMAVYPIIVGLLIFIINSYLSNYIRIVYRILFCLVIVFVPMVIKNLYKTNNYHYNDSYFSKPIDAFNYIFKYDKLKQNNSIFDGYNFIKDNTDNSSLIATNKQNFMDYETDFRCHDLAAYGERHVYLEGYLYSGINNNYKDLNISIANNNFLFSDVSIDEKYQLACNLGINYIFYYKNHDGQFDINDSIKFNKVFENEEVSIYRINS